jgi:hypothetical protein
MFRLIRCKRRYREIFIGRKLGITGIIDRICTTATICIAVYCIVINLKKQQPQSYFRLTITTLNSKTSGRHDTMMFIPRRFLVAALVLLASIGQADAQFFSNIFGFFTNAFNFLCPIAQPVLQGFFNVTLPQCFDIPNPGPAPAPAPTKKGKVVAVSSPVAPPSATP